MVKKDLTKKGHLWLEEVWKQVLCVSEEQQFQGTERVFKRLRTDVVSFKKEHREPWWLEPSGNIYEIIYSEERLVSRLYNQLQFENSKRHNLIKDRWHNWTHFRKDTWKANKNMKRCSSLVIREIDTNWKHNELLLHTRKNAKIWKTLKILNIKCCQTSRTGTFTYC